MLPQKNYEPRRRLWSRRRKVKSKVPRVTAISTDQLVPCPSCGVAMKLFEMHTFECAQCGGAVTAADVFMTLHRDIE